ncbi:polymorphic toxin-type HINT domain-containing protein [Zooshikella ganghwensis]|uniref:polymorphic toxin-type HINT domain-containing protein n=1 Tax=Zooshikella ganghwensis TaxID=202772 RepID=UPI0004223565|nr:polymorphic toxin-type HINT domain-containing protein [Zooshikella ganghwensis]
MPLPNRRGKSSILKHIVNSLSSQWFAKSLLLCLPFQVIHADETGTLPGKFTVNGNGAANYSIPIEVPPGAKGVQPSLALLYNSQSHNGLLGVGWQLSGLQMVARCSQTRHQDGPSFTPGVDFSQNDRFCLNGQRLIVTNGDYGKSGSSYRFERDNWSQITAHGSCGTGPCSFTMVDKMGTTYEFGQTEDARIEAKGRSDVSVWMMNKVIDRNQNYFTYHYSENKTNGESTISRIEYTGNERGGVTPNNSVVFEYENRPDTSSRYLQGQQYSTTKRLQTIITKFGSEIVKNYRINYEQGNTTNRSRINSIQECARNTCFPSTTFSYSDQGNLVHDFGQTVGGIDLGDWTDVDEDDASSYLPMDVNIDGITDLVGIWKKGSSAHASSWQNDGQGHFTKIQDNYVGGWTSRNGERARKYLSMDINADGAADIVEIWKYENNAHAAIWLNEQTGRFNKNSNHHHAGSKIGGWSDPNGSKARKYYPMDVNADGFPDIVEIYKRDSNTGAVAWINDGEGLFQQGPVSNIGGWSDVNDGDARRYLAMDINADGFPDLVEIYKRGSHTTGASLWINDGKGRFSGVSSQEIGGWSDVKSGDERRYLVMNLNGDNLPDILEIWRNGDKGAYSAFWINKGNYSFEKTFGDGSSVGSWTPANGNDARRYLPIDANGDGVDDLISIWRKSDDVTFATIWINNGHGEFNNLSGGSHLGGWSNVKAGDARRYIPVDIDGDGVNEVLEIFKWGNNTKASAWSLRENKPDLLTSITDGLGKNISISYKPITDKAVYTRDNQVDGEESDATWINTTNSLYVVDSHQVKSSETINDCDTSIDCFRFSHKYEEGVVDRNRGWLGFKRTILIDHQHNTKTVTTHHLKFPLTGLIQKVEVLDSEQDTKLGVTTSTYRKCSGEETGCEDLPEKVKRVYLDKQEKQHFTEGQHNYTSQTRYQYNNAVATNGEPTAIYTMGDTKNSQQDAYATCHQYRSGSNWWENTFIDYTKVAHINSDCGAVSAWDNQDYSLTHYVYDGYQNVTSTQRYVNAGLANSQSGSMIDSANYSYDSFGNVKQVKHRSGAVTQYTYDETGTYLTSESTKGEGVTLTSTYQYDQRFGVLTQSTNPNGHTVKSELDAYGRVIAVYETNPRGQLQQVVAKQYKEAEFPGLLKVITKQRKDWEDNNQSSWLTTHEYSDPLGRGRSNHEPGKGNLYTVTDLNIFNVKGQVDKSVSTFFESEPYGCVKLASSESKCNESPKYPETTFQYDRHGRLTQANYPLGGINKYSYELHDDRRLIKQFNDPAASTRNDGRLVSQVLKHNTQGQVIYQKAADGAETRYEYDAIGRLVKITDPSNQVRQFAYNSLGQKIADHSEETETTRYQYDSHGNLVKQIDASGRVVQLEYDQLNRVKRKLSIAGSKTTEVIYEYGSSRSANHHTLGRLAVLTTKVNDRLRVQKEYRYTPNGLIRYLWFKFDINENGKFDHDSNVGESSIFSWEYNALNQAKSVGYPDRSQAKILRSEAGNSFPTALQYEYKRGETNQSQTLAVYEGYHVNGQPTEVVYGNGIIEAHKFDALGRPDQLLVQQNAEVMLLNQSYLWNRANELIGIKDNNIDRLLQTLSHNSHGRLISAKGGYGEFNYSYDHSGNVQTAKGMEYIYDNEKNHQLKKIKNTVNGKDKYSYTYDKAGYLTRKIDHQHGVTWLYAWDGNGNLTEIKRNSALVNRFEYDENNNRTVKKDYQNGVLTNSTYYFLGLHEVVVRQNGSRNYTNYIGKVAAKTEEVSGLNVSGVMTVEDQIGLHTGIMMASVMPVDLETLNDFFTGIGLILTHSEIGAEIIAAALWLILLSFIAVYLMFIALRTASNESVVGQLRYQLLIRCVAKGWLSRQQAHAWNKPTPPAYLADRGKHQLLTIGFVCICFLGSYAAPTFAALKPGQNGVGVPVSGNLLYFHRDHVGSTSIVTNEQGDVVSRVEYTPYGVIDQANSTGEDSFRAKFTGKEYDDNAQLYYFGHRYYDAEIGRFISPDPAAQYHSPYLYGNDDPFAGTDPDGEFFITAIVLTIAIVGGAYAGGAAVNHSANPASWDWKSGKTWGGIIGGAVIGAAGGAAGLAAAEAGFGVAAGLAIDGAIAGTENAAFTAMGGGSMSDIGKSFALGAVTGAAMSGAFRTAGAGFSAARSSLRGMRRGTQFAEAEEMIPCSTNSFTAGTLVSTEKGQNPIEAVKVGDFVWSYNETTGEVELNKVTHLFNHIEDKYLAIVVDGERIEVTHKHPIYAEDKGWVDAEKLVVGDKIRQKDGELATVKSITLINADERVYNFTVDVAHNYFVSDEEVLVHNCGDDGWTTVGKKTKPKTKTLESKNNTQVLQKKVNEGSGATAQLTLSRKTISRLKFNARGTIDGLSGQARDLHPDLKTALNNVPQKIRPNFHGQCAEIDCINKALGLGVNIEELEGTTISVQDVKGGNKGACPSCSHVKKQFKIN